MGSNRSLAARMLKSHGGERRRVRRFPVRTQASRRLGLCAGTKPSVACRLKCINRHRRLTLCIVIILVIKEIVDGLIRTPGVVIAKVVDCVDTLAVRTGEDGLVLLDIIHKAPMMPHVQAIWTLELDPNIFTIIFQILPGPVKIFYRFHTL